MHEKSTVIAEVCELIAAGSLERAAVLLKARANPEATAAPVTPIRAPYPNSALPATKRRSTRRGLTALFLRDGFIDRYGGEQLVFPGVLRLLSHLLPGEFPYHPNWKFGVCHPWYWDLYPTVDHEVPVTLQGPDDPGNWRTTSMRRNLIKSNRSLEDIGWKLVAPSGPDWDGLIGWYVRYVREQPSLGTIAYLKDWYRAAIANGVT
ncbi:MAG TPA: hypothetical protein VFK04_04135 [Gemmatimonadaceae bacterium]|nr:hypothetical protein [Gemmatimonadaceae bacterium]